MTLPAVIIIPTHKPTLDQNEAISLRQCAEILGKHPLRLVCPDCMDVSRYLEIAPSLEVDFFSKEHFQGIKAYNKLKVDSAFYDHYSDYEFLLTYELDAFVFRDDLLEWCGEGWDYIGAPFFENYHKASAGAACIGVGNSGFSLRRVAACREVLRSGHDMFTLGYWWDRYRNKLFTAKQALRQAARHVVHRPAFSQAPVFYEEHEDIFWGMLVPTKFPWFRVADCVSAGRFAFEINPTRLFSENNSHLPFGCHKWTEIELCFWTPFIEQYGHKLPS
jgi:hypothetical protein